MKVDEIEKTATLHAAIVERLVGIVAEAPFWKFVANEELATFRVEGDDAILTWPTTESYYDSCTIEPQSIRVPMAILTLSDEELAKWKIAERTAYDERVAAHHREQAEARRAQEVQLLAELKRRYPDA